MKKHFVSIWSRWEKIIGLSMEAILHVWNLWKRTVAWLVSPIIKFDAYKKTEVPIFENKQTINSPANSNHIIEHYPELTIRDLNRVGPLIHTRQGSDPRKRLNTKYFILHAFWHRWQALIGLLLIPLFGLIGWLVYRKRAKENNNELMKVRSFAERTDLIQNPKLTLRKIILTSVIFIIAVVIFSRLTGQARAIGWWPDGGTSWKQRKQLTLTNNSSSNLSSGSTVAVTVDTSSLVSAGKLLSNCDDLRVLYQPNSTTATEVTRHLIYPSGTTCSTSTSTKVNFKLQAALNTTIVNSTDYFIYYNNSGASTPSSTDDAFDTTSSINASLVCPFDGTTTCAAAETPSTETGAVRYSGSKGALEFDGNSGAPDSVNLGNQSTKLNGKAVTWEMWFYPRSYLTNDPDLFQATAGASQNCELTLGNANGKVYAYCYFTTAGSITTAQSSSALTKNTWNHIAMTYDGTTLRIFINGTLSTSNTVSNDSIKYYASQLGGNFTIGTSGVLDGYIDEVRISNIARYTSNFTTTTAPFVRDSNTIALLHFDENGDDPRNTGKAIDDSGNGNHGTITGAKYVGGLVGVDASTTDTGNVPRQSYAGHEGVFIEEGITNKITNPSFDHSTYNTNWHQITGSGQAYWKLGEAGGASRADSIGSNTLTDHSTVGQVAGKIGNAAQFKSASSNYLDITDNASLSVGNEDFSVAAWVNFSALSADEAIVAKGDISNTSDLEYALYFNSASGYLEFIVADGLGNSAIAQATSPGAPSISTWYYVVAWHNASADTINIQVNNGTVDSTSYTNGSNDGAHSFYIGTDSRTTTGPLLDGNADETGFWKRVLTSNERTALYNAGTGLDPTNLTATANTTAPYYKFGSKSAKLVAGSNGAADFVIDINPVSTATHMYSFYAYDGTSGNVGGTVSSSIIKPLFEGTAQSGGTYTDMGGGWWRVTYSAATSNSSNTYGFQVPTGKTVYVDGVQLEALAYATTYTDGSLGTSYSWSGTAHASTSTRTAASIKYATSLNIAASAGSFNTWIKTPWAGNDSVAHTIFDTDTSAGTLKLSKNSSNNIALTDGTNTATKAVTWSAQQWQHIVGTWTSGTLQVYVNGTAGTSASFSAPTLSTSLYLGQDKTNANLLDGSMSDVRIFDTALSATQVTDLYQSGLVAHGEGPQVDRAGGFDTKGDNPVAIWHMDEGYGTTTYDSTINGNNLTVTGPTWSRANASSRGAVGDVAISFDGSNDYLSRTVDGDFDFGTGSFSISGWFRHSSTISGTDTILARYGTAGYKVYMNSSGYICFGIDDDSTWTPDDSACTTTSFADSKWHHFEAVKSGTSSITTYIDGNSLASDNSIAATATLNTGSNIYLGIDSDASSNPWDGWIDEVTIYPYARSQAQVYADLAGGQKGTVLGAQTKDPLTEGLVGYWKMDESSGNATDSSGNAYTLTNNNSATFTTGKFYNASSYNGSTQYFSTATTISSVQTAAFWVYPSSTSDNYINLNGSAYINSSSGTVSGTGFTGAQVYVNGVLNATTTASTWNHIVVTSTAGISASSFEVGRANGSYLSNTSKMDEVRLYNRALSPMEVQQLYNFAPGPAAYWNLDEKTGITANDASGNANTGTITAGTGSWATGKFGASYLFDAATTVINAGSASSLDNLPATGMSLDAWVYPKSAGENSLGFIMAKNVGTTPSAGWIFRLNSTTSLTFTVDGSTDLVATTNTSLVTQNAWNHVAVSWDGVITTASSVHIYINGVEATYATQTNGASRVDDGTSTFYIGNDSTSARTFDGYIDDVKIYNYARSAKQIVEDMNGGHPAGGSPVGSQVAYWKLDESQGTTANNSGNGGSNLNGTLNNFASPATSTSGWTNDGKVGKGLLFDGSDDAVSLTRRTLLTGLSFSAWIKTTSTDATSAYAGNAALNLIGDHTNSIYIGFGVHDGKVKYNHYAGSWQSVTGTTTVNDGSWHYIGVTHDQPTGSIVVYVDGKKDATGTITYDTTNPAVDRIGAGYLDGSGNGDFFNGSADEVKIYNYALSPSEILVDYNRGSALVMGALSDNSSYQKQAANQEYCVPGDSTSCVAPIGEWKLDEKTGTAANDTSGNANTGTITAGTGGWINGKVGAAYNFDAADTLINAGTASSLDNLPSSGMTLEAWIYPKSAGENSLGFIMAKNVGATPSSGWILRLNSTTSLTFTVDGSTDLVVTTNTSVVTQNAWNHITVSWDGVITTASSVHIYVNGIEVGYATQTNGASRVDDGTSTFYIGNDSTSARTFDGYIDNVRAFNYARTPAQIAWDYNRGGPVGWWKMDECSGGTANDASGGGANGTIYPVSSGNTATGTCASGTTTEMWNDGTTGKFNSSLGFDGTDDYVDIGDDTINNRIDKSTAVTLSAWINPTSIISGAYENLILNNYINAGGWGISGWIDQTNGNKISFGGRSQGADSFQEVDGTSAIPTGSWSHVVGIFDYPNDQIRIYVNGNLETTGSVTFGATSYTKGNATSNDRMGRDASSTYEFNGLVDDVRIFPYALTGTQIKNVMNEGAAVRFGPASGPP